MQSVAMPTVHNFKNLTGRRFTRLLVNSYAGRREHDGVSLWNCTCDCGTTVVAVAKQLTRKQTQSCGCLMIERTKAASTIHGMKGQRIYRIWSGMWNRCRNPECKDFPRYGGRGITVCERWRSFPLFLADMGQPPSPKHSIERRDTNGNYEPLNCMWATNKEQSNNRRNNVIVELDGKRMTLAQLSELSGVSACTIQRRIKRGMSVQDAIQREGARRAAS